MVKQLDLPSIYKEREKLKQIESEYTYSIFTPDHKIRPKRILNDK